MKYITEPLQPGVTYHIYNRGNNRENLFIEERNYPYFLSLYAKYIEPIADTYAYCLMRNHFHFSMRIKTEEEWFKTSQVSKTCEVSPEVPHAKKFDPSRAFSNLFNAYAKSINKGYQRTGSLFEERFGRIPVLTDAYRANLIFYIHYNPQKHKFVKDFRDWHWSSYPALVGSGETKLKREDVLNLFGGKQGFDDFHQGKLDEKELAMFTDEEFEAETS
jgi:REP element-mobilizing transposase RayT